MKERLIEIKAENLSSNDLFKVDFTKSICSLNGISYKYGRVSIGINYYENGEQYTIISGDTIVKLIKGKK